MSEEYRLELSVEEKNRRWSLLRDRLKKAGLSAIIVYGGSQLGVPVHYLTCVWGTKNNMVVFPAEGDPVLLTPTNAIQPQDSITAEGCWIPVRTYG
jgi:hypothetical protein